MWGVALAYAQETAGRPALTALDQCGHSLVDASCGGGGSGGGGGRDRLSPKPALSVLLTSLL
jgi:hypothetical protein